MFKLKKFDIPINLIDKILPTQNQQKPKTLSLGKGGFKV